jgi:hypothetical protein
LTSSWFFSFFRFLFCWNGRVNDKLIASYSPLFDFQNYLQPVRKFRSFFSWVKTSLTFKLKVLWSFKISLNAKLAENTPNERPYCCFADHC